MGNEVKLAALVDEAVARLRAAGLDAPRREAEALLSGLLGIDRAALLAQPERPVTGGDAERFLAGVERRARREPTAYITGRREFWSLELTVTPDVLIPRPATEHLVEAALARVERTWGLARRLRVLDVGTGSGAVAAALATELGTASVVATDTSAAALEVARKNLDELGLLDRVDLRRGDGFTPLRQGERGSFHLIASNPPYVPRAELARLMPDVRDYEPAEALAAGDDGLDVLRRLVDGAPNWLVVGGWLALEHGAEQGPAVDHLLLRRGFSEIASTRDYQGLDRVHVGRWG